MGLRENGRSENGRRVGALNQLVCHEQGERSADSLLWWIAPAQYQ